CTTDKINGYVNFRAKPIIDEKNVIDKLYDGTIVQFKDDAFDNWVVVEHRGKRGYIDKRYLCGLDICYYQ
ncbi:MAG: SH3 domain-containing protein, partial [Cyanobacteria bacterium J06628_3]